MGAWTGRGFRRPGGERAETFLKDFDSVLQADGYAGRNRLTDGFGAWT